MLGRARSQNQRSSVFLHMLKKPAVFAYLLVAFAPMNTLASETEALSDEIDPSLEMESETAPVAPSQAPVPIVPPKINQDKQPQPPGTTDAQVEVTPADSLTEKANDRTSEDQAPNIQLNPAPQSKQSKDSPHSTAELRPTRPSDTLDDQNDVVNTNKATAPQKETQATAEKKNTTIDSKKATTDTQQSQVPLVAKPITILGTEIPPGTATRVAWRPGHSLKGLASQAPVLVVHGAKPGPTLCIAAAVHGDELNGIEVVRQVVHQVKPSKLNGTLIGVPIVNIQGFLRNSRYLVDRRDLNRFFPGTAHGSLASRIAHSFFNQVIMNCSALVDIHTGSFYRDNLPQLRADLGVESVVKLTEGFSSALVLHSTGARGTLRKAAVTSNIPAVTLELGGPMILDEKAVEHGVKGTMNLLNALDMYKKSSFWGTPKPVYYNSQWVRAEHGGIFFSRVKLGQKISPGDLLGTITNPITNEQFLLKSPYDGEVVGLAHNQVVYPGFATTHLAIDPTSDPSEQVNMPPTEKVEKD